MEMFFVTYILSTLLCVSWYVTGYGVDGTALLNDFYDQTNLNIEGAHTSKIYHIVNTEIGSSCGIQSPLLLYATTDILLMSKQPGVHPHTDTIGYKNMEQTVRKSGGFFIYMSMIHGFCHGDMHTGNILFDEATQAVSIIDHGSSIHVPTYDKNPLVVLMECTFDSNPDTIRVVFDLFFPIACFRPEYSPPMARIVAGIWNESIPWFTTEIKDLAARFGFQVDSNILHFLVQYGRIIEAASQSFHATSQFPGLTVLVYEAIQIAQNSSSRAKETHVQYLLSVYTKLVYATGHLTDMENADMRTAAT
jgi:hypothetical protein